MMIPDSVKDRALAPRVQRRESFEMEFRGVRSCSARMRIDVLIMTTRAVDEHAGNRVRQSDRRLAGNVAEVEAEWMRRVRRRARGAAGQFTKKVKELNTNILPTGGHGLSRFSIAPIS